MSRVLDPWELRSYDVHEARKNRKLELWGISPFRAASHASEVTKMPELPDQRVDANIIKTHGNTCEVTNAGGHESGEDESGEKYVKPWVEVKFPDGFLTKYYPNKTSAKAIAADYSTNTDAWVGHSIKFFTQRQNVSGTMREVVYGEPTVAPGTAQHIEFT